MFGLFKAKPAPDGPVVLEDAIAVECSSDTMFGLLNFADSRCWKRAVGTVEDVATGRFRMQLDLAPDLFFTIVVTDAEPGRLYAFDVQITPRPGRLMQSSERYEITPTGSQSCSVRLVTHAHFESGMTLREWKGEKAMMEMAVNNALVKLKLHAEQGVDAIRSIESLQRAA